MPQPLTSNGQKYDFLGIFLSAFCGVHCLITPLAILYIPTLGEHLESPWVHVSLIGLVAFAFYQSVYLHFKRHRSKSILAIGLAGFALLLITSSMEVFAHFAEHGHGHGNGTGHDHHDHHEHGFTLYLAVLGAVLLITSHILNLQKCRRLKSDKS